MKPEEMAVGIRIVVRKAEHPSDDLNAHLVGRSGCINHVFTNRTGGPISARVTLDNAEDDPENDPFLWPEEMDQCNAEETERKNDQ